MICTVYQTRLLRFACVLEQSPILEFLRWHANDETSVLVGALLLARYKVQIESSITM